MENEWINAGATAQTKSPEGDPHKRSSFRTKISFECMFYSMARYWGVFYCSFYKPLIVKPIWNGRMSGPAPSFTKLLIWYCP